MFNESDFEKITTLNREFIPRKTLHTTYVLIGTLAVVSVSELLIARTSRSVSPQIQKATLNPTTLNNEESGSKTKVDRRNEEDGLSSGTKKRMRQMFASNAAVGMRQQNDPIRVDVVGDNVDVLQFRLPSMNEGLANGLIRDLGRGDANFWNGMRLMDFTQIVFCGDNFKKIVTRKEIIAYSQDYEKYKEAFLRALKRLQAGANERGTT
jgi:hypothetical protein